MFREEDLQLLEQKGITPEQAKAQLNRFATGFPYLKILDVARTGNGITTLSEEQQNAAVARWQEYLNAGGEVCKFVPASGAASRMFKALFEFVDGDTDTPKPGSDVERVIADIDKMAFVADLNEATKGIYGLSVEELKAAGRNKDLIAAIIRPEGLNYGNLPKGLLKFHSYAQGSRTPIEEQLVEGAQTAVNSEGVVNLHFTVSSNHRQLFEAKLEEVIPAISQERGVKFNVSLSEQKPSTDTIAANPDNTPFMENGKLLFRPGGHGALIENLNEQEADVIFIKNIDNVVPDRLKGDTVRYKQLLAGVLVTEQKKVFEKLQDPTLTAEENAKIQRPLRVCGVVKNTGEPGGGPFLVREEDGTISCQILESSQISDPALMQQATHFNPVDLVCATRDAEGKPYYLPDFVDEKTGFISHKSKDGKELLALELPGLWNGAMSRWNTIFVEVPVSTFNPVKTVNDLLRAEHQ